MLSAQSDESIYSKSLIFYTDALSFFRLILNAILYITSNDPEITQELSGRRRKIEEAEAISSKIKSKKAKQNAKKISELDYGLVGRNVQSICINKDSTHYKGDNQEKNAFEYAVRFLVRGHWKNQAFGMDLSGRRLIRIKPYYKGPEMADLINKPYVAKI